MLYMQMRDMKEQREIRTLRRSVTRVKTFVLSYWEQLNRGRCMRELLSRVQICSTSPYLYRRPGYPASNSFSDPFKHWQTLRTTYGMPILIIEGFACLRSLHLGGVAPGRAFAR